MEGQAQLSNEIAQIEEQLAKKREQLQEQQGGDDNESMLGDKEMLHDVVREHIQAESQPSQSTQTDDDTDEQDDDNQDTLPPITADTPSYLNPELQGKVQSLVNTAFTDSIKKAAQSARDMNNPALMDAFHDSLVDQLYDDLVERGKLKRVE